MDDVEAEAETQTHERLERLEFYRNSKRIPPDAQVRRERCLLPAAATVLTAASSSSSPSSLFVVQLLLFKPARTLLRIEPQAYDPEVLASGCMMCALEPVARLPIGIATHARTEIRAH